MGQNDNASERSRRSIQVEVDHALTGMAASPSSESSTCGLEGKGKSNSPTQRIAAKQRGEHFEREPPVLDYATVGQSKFVPNLAGSPSQATLHNCSAGSSHPPDPPRSTAKGQEHFCIKNLCVKLLVDGCVQTFVDLFEISRSQRQHGEIAANEDFVEAVPTEDRSALSLAHESQKRQAGYFQLGVQLAHISSTMAEAENAVWEEHWEKAVSLYHEVASCFVSSKNGLLALHFLQRCISISQETEKFPELAVICREIGDVHKNEGNWEDACNAYKESLSISTQVESSTEEQKAAEALAIGCAALARHRMKNNKLEDAENLLQESLRCAKTSANARLEWEALHCLGDLMRRLGKYNDAIAAHEKCIERSRETADHERESEARAALAQALQSAGRLDEAVQELERLLQVAEKAQESRAQAAACMSLGSLYNGKGDSVRALEMFKKYFDLTTAIGDSLPLKEARIMLGISRANCNMEEYKELFRHDVGDLLAWKSSRKLPTSDQHTPDPSADGVSPREAVSHRTYSTRADSGLGS